MVRLMEKKRPREENPNNDNSSFFPRSLWFLGGLLAGALPNLFVSGACRQYGPEFLKLLQSADYIRTLSSENTTTSSPQTESTTTDMHTEKDSQKSVDDWVGSLLFPLNKHGKLDLHPSMPNLMIDIRARESDYLAWLHKDNTTCLILVDPLPDSYIPLAMKVAEHAVLNIPKGQSWLNPQYKHQALIIRAAMGETEGVYDFNVARGPACGSILKTARNNSFWCFDSKDTIKTAVLRLERILDLVPPHIDNLHLKVDAEGADLTVLKGAGDQIKKFGTVIIECAYSNVTRHEGDCHVHDAVKYMDQYGFEAHILGKGKNQANILFVPRQSTIVLPPLLRVHRLAMSGLYRKLYQQADPSSARPSD
ncbi:unknown protein [Seminavis robusta]|uniref:Methyltransferase FkbM domain-containing protein n=1 Tax=Seminavis robusta TaxID=568900 RepID=A0A9N8HVP2_9STRA|nr:unknown protein [Seminavis robusta]|eukprot:Sro1533_g280300.1 n/a (365) ;mRNA; f:5113-6207